MYNRLRCNLQSRDTINDQDIVGKKHEKTEHSGFFERCSISKIFITEWSEKKPLWAVELLEPCKVSLSIKDLLLKAVDADS